MRAVNEPSAKPTGSATVAAFARRWLAGPRRGAVACLLLATLGTLALAAPVLIAPDERLIGREIVGRKGDPFWAIGTFLKPRSPSLRTQPATDYVGAAVASVTGGVAAYNVVVLATFPLAALFAFLFARHLTGSSVVAWTAALFYAFSPFHIAHAAYHPHIAQIQWVPLAMLALWRAVEMADVRRLALLLASLSLVALSNFYFGLVVGVLLPAMLVAAWWSRDREAGGRPAIELSRVVAVLAVLAGAGWLYARLFAPAVLDDASTLAWPRQDLVDYTARWWSYLVPPVDHPWLDGVARRAMAAGDVRGGLVEQQVTIGFGVTLLAAAACALWLRDRRRPELRAVPGLCLIAAVAFVFSLPPDWRLGGVAFAGPSAWLYELAPMFRAHARFALLVGLPAYILAGLALDRARRSDSRAVKAAALGLLAIAIFELTPLPPWRWRDILPTTAHRWLFENRPQGTILDCVSIRDVDQRNVVPLFGHGLELVERGTDCGEPGLAGKLAARGVSTLLVRRDGRDAAGLLAVPRPGFVLEREFPDAVVWRVVASPARFEVELGDQFHLREYAGERSFRWMPQDATLALHNRSEAPALVWLDLTLHAFPDARDVELLLPSGEALAARVGREPAPFRFGPVELPPGRRELRLRSLSPAVVADELLRNGDRRRLAVGLWEWSVVDAGAASADASSAPPAD